MAEFIVTAHKRDGILKQWHVTKTLRIDADASDAALVRASDEIDELNARHPATSRIAYDLLQCTPKEA